MPNTRLDDVPALLRDLEQAYATLLSRQASDADDQARLRSVWADFAWYAGRLGPDRWARVPRAHAWTFTAILQHVTEQAVQEATTPIPPPIQYFIDHGKEHVGQVAELWFLLTAEH